jgi:hypothetical protein
MPTALPDSGRRRDWFRKQQHHRGMECWLVLLQPEQPMAPFCRMP